MVDLLPTLLAALEDVTAGRGFAEPHRAGLLALVDQLDALARDGRRAGVDVSVLDQLTAGIGTVVDRLDAGDPDGARSAFRDAIRPDEQQGQMPHPRLAVRQNGDGTASAEELP